MLHDGLLQVAKGAPMQVMIEGTYISKEARDCLHDIYVSAATSRL